MPIEGRASGESVYSRSIGFAGMAKAEGRPALAIEHAEKNFGVRSRRDQPRHLRSDIAQSVGAKRTVQDDRRIDEGPRVRMLGILPTKVGEKLTGFELEIGRQRSRLKEGFLQFDRGFVVLVELENDIREALEVRIDRPAQGDFRV